MKCKIVSSRSLGTMARRRIIAALLFVSAFLFSRCTSGQDEKHDLCSDESIFNSDTIRIHIQWVCKTSNGGEEIVMARFHKGWYKVQYANTQGDVVKRRIYKNRIERAFRKFLSLRDEHHSNPEQITIGFEWLTGHLQTCVDWRLDAGCRESTTTRSMKHALKIWK